MNSPSSTSVDHDKSKPTIEANNDAASPIVIHSKTGVYTITTPLTLVCSKLFDEYSLSSDDSDPWEGLADISSAKSIIPNHSSFEIPDLNIPNSFNWAYLDFDDIVRGNLIMVLYSTGDDKFNAANAGELDAGELATSRNLVYTPHSRFILFGVEEIVLEIVLGDGPSFLRLSKQDFKFVIVLSTFGVAKIPIHMLIYLDGRGIELKAPLRPSTYRPLSETERMLNATPYMEAPTGYTPPFPAFSDSNN